MLIRRMRPEDAPVVAEIHIQSWREAYKGIINQDFLDSLDLQKRTEGWKAGVEKNDPPLLRLVCEKNGKVRGFACGLENRSPVEMPDCDSELWAIYVDPASTRIGVGGALLEGFIAELGALGKSKLCIWTLTDNHRARHFYEKSGGVLRGKKVTKIAGQELPEVGYEFVVGRG